MYSQTSDEPSRGLLLLSDGQKRQRTLGHSGKSLDIQGKLTTLSPMFCPSLVLEGVHPNLGVLAHGHPLRQRVLDML